MQGMARQEYFARSPGRPWQLVPVRGAAKLPRLAFVVWAKVVSSSVTLVGTGGYRVAPTEERRPASPSPNHVISFRFTKAKVIWVSVSRMEPVSDPSARIGGSGREGRRPWGGVSPYKGLVPSVGVCLVLATDKTAKLKTKCPSHFPSPPPFAHC